MNSDHTLTFEAANGHCPAGEKFSENMIHSGKIPVISCEGSCIRGEIARLAANMLAKEEDYGRGCHGEFISVPESGMARWALGSDPIVVIDGCFLHCHGRLMAGIYKKEQLRIFDALCFYGKYTDIMDPEDVPEAERKETAKLVFEHILRHLSENTEPVPETEGVSSCCCGAGK